MANDDDAYVAIAVAKGQDRKDLLQLKRTLRERLLTYPAWDVTAPVRVKPIRVRWRRPGWDVFIFTGSLFFEHLPPSQLHDAAKALAALTL